jgi:hypothetical protein
MGKFAEIAFALLILGALHWGFNVAVRRAGKGIAKALRTGRRSSTTRSRDKLAKRTPQPHQEGEVPPLENPHLD